MSNIGFEVALILLLVLANGLFSMAEMAVVSARKARLRQRAEEGSRGAQVALDLAANPNDFLSTVQVGITLIGTLAGAFGGATVAEKFAVFLNQFPLLAPHRESIAITVVVLIISYLSLVLGELVPKSLALSRPEGIATAVAPLMRGLSRVGSPFVRFLTFSTNVVMKILPVRASGEAPVTEEEIKVLIAQGAEHGTLANAERDLVEGVFRLGDRRVVELMQPRGRVHALDVDQPWNVNRARIAESTFSRFPVMAGDLDHLVGVVTWRHLFLAGQAEPDLRALATKPLIVPEATPALEVLKRFQATGQEMAFVVDEHGGIQGLVTLTDLLEAVVGDLPAPGEIASTGVTRRDDGSFLLDGVLPVHELVGVLGWRKLPWDDDSFTTLGGLVLAQLCRIPEPGDQFLLEGWRFEVLDMDRNRVDKVLAQRVPASPASR
jgi:putative hemolysin